MCCQQEENELDTADDGEPGEDPHRAPDEAQLGLNLDILVSLNIVKGRCVKVDLHQFKSGAEFFS